MVDRYITAEPLEEIQAVADVSDIRELQKECRGIYVHEDLRNYIVELVQATRKERHESGVSPRGTLALLRASQGYALVSGREYVVPEDIKYVAVPVLAHRMLAEFGSGKANEDYIRGLLNTVALPTEDWKKV